MKRTILYAAMLSAIISSTPVLAFELKTPQLLNTQETSSKTAAPSQTKLEMQAAIKYANNAITPAISLSDSAVKELANVLLSKEIRESCNDQTALIDAMVSELKKEDFNQIYESYTPEQKIAYKKAVTNLIISDNRFQNISRKCSSASSVALLNPMDMKNTKTEMLQIKDITLKVKNNASAKRQLLKSIEKVNIANNVDIIIPANEEVKYDRYSGVVGNINQELDIVNVSFTEAYNTLASILLDTKDYQKLKTKAEAIKNNKKLSEQERDAELNKVLSETDALIQAQMESGAIDKKMKALSAERKIQYINACANLFVAGIEYYNLGMKCSKLGMKIASNPLLAASLAFELDQIKYTGKTLKNQATNVKKIAVQIKKINKANNIEVKMPENKASKMKKVNFSKIQLSK